MEAAISAPKKRERRVPASLIKEVLDGQPIYYKGYRSVMYGHKSLEEIMGASSLQGLIILYIQRLLNKNLDEMMYLPMTGEIGLHLSHRNNLSGDIMLYHIGQIEKFTKRYFDVPPLLQVEVDVEIDTENISQNLYVTRKTQRLLEFGVKKVIWVFTATQSVWVAEPEQDWRIINWNKEIELFEGTSMNLGDYLTKMNVELE
ncbi:MAG: Uma2 family endonuclease [Emticicia sp.]|nr:Uma2 family endonuclease [Emticicia sp.]